MAIRLSDKLLEGAHQRFVGRAYECTLFKRALEEPELPFFVLYLFGPGGVGKTTLLREFHYTSSQAEIPAYPIDGRLIDPTPEAFEDALRMAMRLSTMEDLLEALARGGRQVILVDTFEMLAPLEGWLRERFLPRLSDNVMVVLAGRMPLSKSWTTDPGWQALVRSIPLRNLNPQESRTYLTQAGVPDIQHDGVLGFTHGHPLALSLIVETYAQRPGMAFEPGSDPDMIKTLLDRFVMKVPTPAHRVALEACALVHYTTESLLAEMVGNAEVATLFEWLRDLSFVESSALGLYPHDLAREALAYEVRWRNPEWYNELHHRARTYYMRRLDETRGRDQQRVLSDYMYLHRDNPVIKPFLDWHDTGSSVPTPATEADWPLLEAMVARHEGEASAQRAAYWFARQPQGVLVVRGSHHEPVGFLFGIALDAVTEADRHADPGLDKIWRHLQSTAPLRPGERGTCFRFWMADDSYQSVSAIQSLLFLKMAQHYLTTPDLAFSTFVCADPAFWEPFCAYAGLEHIPEVDFAVGEKRFGVFGHDWRSVPPALWLDQMAQHETSTTLEPIPTPARVVQRLIVLSEDEFREAVRQALRDYTRPFQLRDNPLLASRMVAEARGFDLPEDERITRLTTLLREAAETLRDTPRLDKAYRAIDRTYLHPAPSQEIAAEMLDLPYSTFRRYLKTGVDEMITILWQREVGG